mgnify:CR=1 FL=1
MHKKVKFMDVIKYLWKNIFKNVKTQNKCTYDECICKLNNVRKKVEDLPLNN